MADSSIPIKSSTGQVVQIDTVTTPDGDERQVVAIGNGEGPGLLSPATEDTLADLLAAITAGLQVSDASPEPALAALVAAVTAGLQVRDNSPPLAALDKGAKLVDPGASSEVVPDAPGRVKITLCHAGPLGSARVWLGLGEPAEQGSGLFLDPGGVYDEYVSGAITANPEGASQVLLTWQEYGS